MFKEKIQAIRSDDDAVSPVIGVILMVAVTVVLAAVIGAFVFGMGDSLNQPAPDAQIEFDYTASDNNVSISHDGGQTINADNTGDLSINAEGVGDSQIRWEVGDGAGYTGNASSTIDSSVSAGDTVAYVGDTSSPTSVELIWNSPDGGNSQVIGTWEQP